MNGVGLGVAGFEFDPQRHFAFVGELNGIANQIEDDLTQACGIGANDFRNVPGDIAKKFETLFIGAIGERFQSGFQAIAQVEVAEFQFDLAGLYFREIENVVDDGKQGVCGELDGAQVFTLLGSELGIESQIGHANDAIQRSTNLVAHIGEKFAFRAAGGFSGLFGSLPLEFGLFSSGDIVADADDTGNVAVAVEQRNLGGEQPDAMPGLGDRLLFMINQRLLGGNHVLFVLVVAGGELARKEIKVGFADQFAGRVQAHSASHRRIGNNEAAQRVFDIHQVRDVIDQSAQDLAFLGKGFFRMNTHADFAA